MLQVCSHAGHWARAADRAAGPPAPSSPKGWDRCQSTALRSSPLAQHLSHWHLPLIPCTSLPALWSSFPSRHVSELGYPTLKRGRKPNRYTNMHTNIHNTNTHKCMHLFSLPLPVGPPPPLSLHQPDLSS